MQRNRRQRMELIGAHGQLCHAGYPRRRHRLLAATRPGTSATTARTGPRDRGSPRRTSIRHQSELVSRKLRSRSSRRPLHQLHLRRQPCDPVIRDHEIAPGATSDYLLAVRANQAVRFEPVERCIQGCHLQRHTPLRRISGLPQNLVPVTPARSQSGENPKRSSSHNGSHSRKHIPQDGILHRRCRPRGRLKKNAELRDPFDGGGAV